MGRVGVGVGDMTRAVYDPDLDGLIAVGQIEMTASKIAEGQGLGAGSAEIDVPAAGIWTLAETLSPAGGNTIDSSVLATHDLWMLVIDVIAVPGNGSTNFRMRLNDDDGVDYNYHLIATEAISGTSGDTSFMLGDSVEANGLMGVIYVQGKRKGASNYNTVRGGVSGDNSSDTMLHGYYRAAADITKFNFLSTAITGKIKIYYMDY